MPRCIDCKILRANEDFVSVKPCKECGMPIGICKQCDTTPMKEMLLRTIENMDGTARLTVDFLNGNIVSIDVGKP